MRIRIKFRKCRDPRGIVHTKWFDEPDVRTAIKKLGLIQRAERVLAIDVKCEGVLVGAHRHEAMCNRIVPEGKGAYCPAHKDQAPLPETVPTCPQCGSTIACGCDDGDDGCIFCGSTSLCNCEA